MPMTWNAYNNDINIFKKEAVITFVLVLIIVLIIIVICVLFVIIGYGITKVMSYKILLDTWRICNDCITLKMSTDYADCFLITLIAIICMMPLFGLCHCIRYLFINRRRCYKEVNDTIADLEAQIKKDDVRKNI